MPRLASDSKAGPGSPRIRITSVDSRGRPGRLNLDTLEIDRTKFIRALRHRALALYPWLVPLPRYPAISEKQVEYVAAAVKEILLNAGKRKAIPITGRGAR